MLLHICGWWKEPWVDVYSQVKWDGKFKCYLSHAACTYMLALLFTWTTGTVVIKSFEFWWSKDLKNMSRVLRKLWSSQDPECVCAIRWQWCVSQQLSTYKCLSETCGHKTLLLPRSPEWHQRALRNTFVLYSVCAVIELYIQLQEQLALWQNSK